MPSRACRLSSYHRIADCLTLYPLPALPSVAHADCFVPPTTITTLSSSQTPALNSSPSQICPTMSQQPTAPKVLDQPGVPGATKALHSAKAASGLTFAQIAEKIGRNELWVAALFYGQAKPDPEDLTKLSDLLKVDIGLLKADLGDHFFPDRAGLMECPPRDPTIYRLWEAIAVYGYPIKHLIHEKGNDAIMSAIDFSGLVERVADPKGDRIVITLNGKLLPYAKPTQ
ncbi:hypothetical protein V8E36_000220 [Tilletia maclaganii]